MRSKKITVVLSILCFFLVNLGAINSESLQEKKGQKGIREEVTVTLKLLQLGSSYAQDGSIVRSSGGQLAIVQKQDEGMKLYPPLLLVPEGNRQYLNVGWSEESEGQAEYSAFEVLYLFMTSSVMSKAGLK